MSSGRLTTPWTAPSGLWCPVSSSQLPPGVPWAYCSRQLRGAPASQSSAAQACCGSARTRAANWCPGPGPCPWLPLSRTSPGTLHSLPSVRGSEKRKNVWKTENIKQGAREGSDEKKVTVRGKRIRITVYFRFRFRFESEVEFRIESDSSEVLTGVSNLIVSKVEIAKFYPKKKQQTTESFFQFKLVSSKVQTHKNRIKNKHH